MTSHQLEVVMKKLLTAAAGLITGATMLLAAAPAMARTDVLVQVHSPAGYSVQRVDYAQPRPVYEDHHRQQVQPQRGFQDHGRYYEHARPVYRDHDDYRGRAIRFQRRDSDRDGVPDRFDARPHNPYRY
jgi:hypothetical protein